MVKGRREKKTGQMWGMAAAMTWLCFKKKKNPSNHMFNFQLNQLAGLTCSVAAQLLALGLC